MSVILGSFNNKSSAGYEASFNVSNNVDYVDTQSMFGMDVHSDIPTVTDFFPNVNFQIDESALPSSAVQFSNAEHIDTGAMQENVNATIGNYLALNAQVVNVMMDSVKAVAGAQVAGQIGKQLIAGGDVTKFQAATAVFDPTGVLGAMYSVFDTIKSELGRLPNAEVSKVLEQAAAKMRQDSNPADRDLVADKNPIQMPDGFNGSNVTAKKIEGFLERDPMKDPVVRKAQEVQVGIDQVEKNNALIAGHDHRAGDMIEKASAAVESGDQGAVREFTSNESQAVAVLSGEADDVQLYNAEGAAFFSESTSGLPAMANSDAAHSLDTDTKAFLTASLSNEPDLNKLTMDQSAKLGMAT